MFEYQRKKLMGEYSNHKRDEIYSRAIRAGKRTYFFDVKSTKGDDYYLTITESKKRFNDDGRFFFEKHKLFLYKEDFDKFSEGLADVMGYIKREQPQTEERTHFQNDGQASKEEEATESAAAESAPASNDGQETEVGVEVEASSEDNSFSDVDFDDLGKDGSEHPE